MKTMWLSLGAIVAAIVAACAAGEDNTDVQVTAETNLPRCTPRPSREEQKLPPDPPNESRDVDNSGARVGSGGASSSSGSTTDDCTNSSSSGGSSSSSSSGSR